MGGASKQVTVAIPQGVVGGQTIQVPVDGQMIQVTVPQGMVAGQQFSIAVPVAAGAAVVPMAQQQMVPQAMVGGGAGPLEFLRNEFVFTSGRSKESELMHTYVVSAFNRDQVKAVVNSAARYIHA